jgi:hypothetical protein
MGQDRKRDNIRTAVLLACVAGMFFFGFIVKMYLLI